ncbi:MAG: YihY/virulence factor BrkB family protein [Geminicoccaceae bacterium]|nr:YihY/virulence factor BrkB family protein [Geminicoccaceae bacterium]
MRPLTRDPSRGTARVLRRRGHKAYRIRLDPMEPFASGGLEARGSPVRTRRIRPPDIGWYRRVLWPAFDHFISDQGVVLAGYIAFTSVFAMFPFLVFLLSFAGFVGQGAAAAESIRIALDLLPPEVAGVLSPVVDEIRRGPHGTLITFSILLTLWFSSSGLESLRHALNLAFNAEGHGSFWGNRLKSIGITIASAMLILAAMTVLIGLPVAQDLLAWLAQKDVFTLNLSNVLRYLIGTGILLFLTLSLYILLPKVSLGLLDVLPGAIVSVAVWAGATSLYSVYLRSFGRYSILYGSLGGVIFTLFYFYISAIIFIFGAQLNAAILREAARPPGEPPV